MPANPNTPVTPAILPTDLDFHQDDRPAEAEDFEAGENNPTEDDIIDNPERAINQLPVGGTRDAPDIRRLRDSYSPNAR